ncbi:hypothetical protein Sa4125_18570 [Aureimonas sp. SA4125]|uniref:DUF1127 domain-containing protein n=1 Tax=Aureimonas sp. SA4125 TaxID=2826993 RepID=UPI001CC6A5C7|nr:DUF1127 domain-containing protein [Aureimonas sp. SA4125]BDA84315.1 hypothetical protein Sa4125_18570 [Aureimonas sp. SA4125]
MSIHLDERVTIHSGGVRSAEWTRRIAARASRWVATLRRHSALYVSRRQLLDLSEAQLRDIGVTRAEAAAEARRGFGWR